MTKKSIMLPFHDQPYSLMYHYLAFPMGIIQENATEDIVPWLCKRYTNCYFIPTSVNNKFDICVEDKWAEKDKILIQQNISLLRELYSKLSWDYLDLLKKMINQGYYPYGAYNEEWIPQKSAYRRAYQRHDYLLIGYDDERKIFYSAGYLSDSTFKKFEIPYESMTKALNTLKDPFMKFQFYKYNPSAKYSFDLKRSLCGVHEYITSSSSIHYTDGRSMGIDAVRELGTYLQGQIEEGHWGDYRYSRGLMEHKFFMKLRIEYLYRQGYLSEESLISFAEQVYMLSNRVHMLTIKYIMTSKKEIGESIANSIKEILDIEKNYLPIVDQTLQLRWEREEAYQ